MFGVGKCLTFAAAAQSVGGCLAGHNGGAEIVTGE